MNSFLTLGPPVIQQQQQQCLQTARGRKTRSRCWGIHLFLSRTVATAGMYHNKHSWTVPQITQLGADPSSRGPGFNTRPFLMEFVVDEVDMGQATFWVLWCLYTGNACSLIRLSQRNILSATDGVVKRHTSNTHSRSPVLLGCDEESLSKYLDILERVSASIFSAKTDHFILQILPPF